MADQQSLQGVVHFLLWKTLVAQMYRDPAKICNHPKKHHLAQCQSIFKRTLESTTSTETCTCIPAGLNCNSDQTFKLFTQKPPEHHNGYVCFFFLQQQESNINRTYWDPCFWFFFFFNNKNQTSMEQIYTHVFVFFCFCNKNQTSTEAIETPVFFFFATTRIKHQPKQLKPMFLFFCNNKNQTSTKAIETHVFFFLQTTRIKHQQSKQLWSQLQQQKQLTCCHCCWWSWTRPKAHLLWTPIQASQSFGL